METMFPPIYSDVYEKVITRMNAYVFSLEYVLKIANKLE